MLIYQWWEKVLKTILLVNTTSEMVRKIHDLVFVDNAKISELMGAEFVDWWSKI